MGNVAKIDVKAVAAAAVKIGAVASVVVAHPELVHSWAGIASLVALIVATVAQAQTGKVVSAAPEPDAPVADTIVSGFGA